MPAYCLSIHSSYACAHSGACCAAGWPISAEPPLLAALSRHQLGPEWTAERAFEIASSPEGPVSILRTDGQVCVFYERDRRRCAVHRQVGPATLPTACRNFPRITLSDRRGVFITLSHFCPTAAALLLDDRDITIVEAPPSLSLNGAVEGLDATGVLPPLLRPGMLTDAEGYAAWEAEAIGVWNDRRYTAKDALAIVSAATGDVCNWQPGTETLATRARSAFAHARAARDRPPAPQTPIEHAIKSFLAAHLFASWHAYQDGGLQAVVRAVETAFTTLDEELAPRLSSGQAPRLGSGQAPRLGSGQAPRLGSGQAPRLRSARPEHPGRAPAPFITAVRAADFRLRHSCADVRPRPLPPLRRR